MPGNHGNQDLAEPSTTSTRCHSNLHELSLYLDRPKQDGQNLLLVDGSLTGIHFHEIVSYVMCSRRFDIIQKSKNSMT